MIIEKINTPNFDQYTVFEKKPLTLPILGNKLQRLVARLLPKQTIDFEDTLVGVLKADDKSGLIVQQVITEEGEWYSNGIDEVCVGNTEKFLLLTIPAIRHEFLVIQRFVPKITTTYRKNIIIKYRGPIASDVIIKEIAADTSAEVRET